jgi:hypothetical protein
VSGSFTRVDGQRRGGLAAFDRLTGELLPWAPEADGLVRTLLLTDTALYVGGDFRNIGGQARSALAALDLMSGAALPFNPNVNIIGGPASVRALTRVGSTLYFGGVFLQVGSVERRNAAAVDLSTGALTPWAPVAYYCECNDYDVAPYIGSLAAGEHSIYLGGHFSLINGVGREGIAEVDLETGQLTAWDPQPGPANPSYAPYITAVVISNESVFVAGGFEEIGGAHVPGLAEIDRRTAVAKDWAPFPDVAPAVLLLDANTVYAGGQLRFVGGKARRQLAAFDARSGEVLDWNPDVDGFAVFSLALGPSALYAGGAFWEAGGKPRSSLAALDLVTGAATDWIADVDETVNALEVVGDQVWVGGSFSTIGGATRRGVAAINLDDASVSPINLALNSDVYGITHSSNVVYIGGNFSTAYGQERRQSVAVDAPTGSLLAWQPKPDGGVYTIAIKDSVAFLGGAFAHLSGEPRERLGAVNAITGDVTEWRADAANPNPNLDRVYKLAVSGSQLFVAGSFQSVNGVARNGVAALDAGTAQLFDWDPQLGGSRFGNGLDPGIAWSIAPFGNTVYVGGSFSWSGTTPNAMLAGFSIHPEQGHPAKGRHGSIALAAPTPNPTPDAATVSFTLESKASVSLAVYNVNGRRVRLILDQQLLDAGLHKAPIETSGLPAGFYFCRLDALGESASRKFVVLR